MPLVVPHVTTQNCTRPTFKFLFSVVRGLLKAHRYHKELVIEDEKQLTDKYTRRQFLEKIITTVVGTLAGGVVVGR